jgi:hypothetical protein
MKKILSILQKQKILLMVVGLVGVAGVLLTLFSHAGTQEIIREDFSSNATNFSAIKGGTWAIANGQYSLTNASTLTDVANGNLTIHNTVVPAGDFTLNTNATATATSSAWDDFSVIFNYSDPSNFYFASFNESNNSNTNGIFKVSNGTQTQIADFASVSTGGTLYNIKITKTGSTIAVYRDGAQMGSFSDSAVVSGKVGYGTYNNNGFFDNLSVIIPVTTPSATLLHEDFSTVANNFISVRGGSWSISNGKYNLSNASNTNDNTNGNLSIHNTAVPNGDFTYMLIASAIATSSPWDDFSVIFGYQDVNNYYYASFNESNNATTSGIFKVASGASTQVADITSVISGGTSYNVKIQRLGATVSVYRNNTLAASFSDNNLTGGKVGVGAYNNNAVFDDLDVTTASNTSGGTTITYLCSDSKDNDADGKVDYPADSGCSSSTDNDEVDLLPPPPPPSTSTNKAWDTSKGLPEPLAQSGTSNIKYVATNGSSSNSGTMSSPWSLSYALNSAAASSSSGIDQIILMDGTYTASSYPVKINGTVSRPVTVKAQNTGKAIIHSWFQVEDTSYTRISGLIMDGMNNTTRSGFFIGNNSPVKYLEISYNEIKNFRNPNASVVYERGGNGIFIGQHSNSSTNNQNVYLLSNKIHDIGNNYPYDHGMYLKMVENAVIANNIIYNIHYGYGIQIYGNFDRNYVINNTIYNGSTKGGSGLIVAATGGYPDNNIIANNLFVKHYIDNNSVVPCDSTLNSNSNCNVTRPSTSGEALTNCCGASTGTGNVVRNNREWTPYISGVTRSNLWSYASGMITSGNTSANPAFIDEANKNFHLTSSSQVINNGELFGLLLDSDGLSRDGSPDIGAFEYR